MYVEVVEHDGSLTLLVAGELDLATAPLLDEELTRAEDTDAAPLVVDLERVEFIDSTGLKVLLKHALLSSQNGCRLRLTRGSPQARRMFEISGAMHLLPFVDG